MKTKILSLIVLVSLLFAFASCEKKDEVKVISVNLGAQASTTVDGFYAVGEDKTYTMAEACPDSLVIDIFCFYEASTGNNIALASPGSGITGIFTGETAPEFWKHKNLTMFNITTLTAAQFDAIQDGDEIIATSYDAVNARKKAKDVQVDQVWAFHTEDGYFGLIKIKTVTQGTDGSVLFELKKMKATLIEMN